jgi:hypothetical protein
MIMVQPALDLLFGQSSMIHSVLQGITHDSCINTYSLHISFRWRLGHECDYKGVIK